MMKKQQGITLVGMLLTVAVVVMCAIVVLRVVPVYIQYFAIVQSIKSLNETPISSLTGDPQTDVGILRASLTRRLDINSVDDLKPNQLSIVSDGGGVYTVKLDYQVIRPLVYNVSLYFDFKKTEKVKVGSEN